MHNVERYLLWTAIAVLFVLYFFRPMTSNYSGQPNSITKLAEFSSMNDDIKRAYDTTIIPILKEYATTFNKFWGELTTDDKAAISRALTQLLTTQVANAKGARQMNGHDWFTRVAQGGNAASSPAASNTASVSHYMIQPLVPMVSGFTLQDFVQKAATATKMA